MFVRLQCQKNSKIVPHGDFWITKSNSNVNSWFEILLTKLQMTIFSERLFLFLIISSLWASPELLYTDERKRQIF